MEAIKTKEFIALCNIGRLDMRQFIKWIILTNTFLGMKIADMLIFKPSAHSKTLEVTVLATIPDANLQKSGMDQDHWVLREFCAVALYVLKNNRVREYR